ncbi:hypothetical protein E3N88_30611 [Mikania micrantha]|uniref:Uncharacterized protein n=1 Tax=Mikania micrantha TaxID=192012 RepID=A0A5N6MPD4_9ASTR|nr:hypothetical protein E3N88_30611 [Mikania micrantha]
MSVLSELRRDQEKNGLCEQKAKDLCDRKEKICVIHGFDEEEICMAVKQSPWLFGRPRTLENHLKLCLEATKVERRWMPVLCHMFLQTVTGAAQIKLPSK